MGRMRILLAIALLGIGVAAGGAARAADLPAVNPQFFFGYSEAAHRGEMVRLYDDEPGVVIRAYWRAPWHYRHYFPATGHRHPAADRPLRKSVGRQLSAASGADLSPILVEQLGGAAPLCRQRTAAPDRRRQSARHAFWQPAQAVCAWPAPNPQALKP
jgi:hypothetical protein